MPDILVHDYSPKQPDLSPNSGLSRTKEHVPVIVSPVRSDGVTIKRSPAGSTTTKTTLTIAAITTTSTRGTAATTPVTTTSTRKDGKRSPERPPRSIEQPQAKSAFSRPKQSKTIHSSYENESSSLLIARNSCVAPSNDVPLFRDR